MFVYRVQNRWSREGPYRCDWVHSHELAEDHSDGQHPGMRHLLGEDQYWNGYMQPWKSAMVSLDALRAWFDGWVDRIVEYSARFVVVMVEIDPTGYAELDGQVAYHEGTVLSEIEFPISYLKEGVLP